MVADLVLAGAKVAAFRTSVERAVGEVFPGKAPKMIPDAYRIDSITRCVDLLEVEVYHRICRAKEVKIRAWSKWLGERGWMLRLFVYDSRGVHVEFDTDTFEPTQAEIDRWFPKSPPPPEAK